MILYNFKKRFLGFASINEKGLRMNIKSSIDLEEKISEVFFEELLVRNWGRVNVNPDDQDLRASNCFPTKLGSKKSQLVLKAAQTLGSGVGNIHHNNKKCIFAREKQFMSDIVFGLPCKVQDNKLFIFA